jgi:rubrerythrin
MALELDEKLVRFYQHMARHMSDYEEVRTFFESLAEQEKQEKAQLKVNAQMIKEL